VVVAVGLAVELAVDVAVELGLADVDELDDALGEELSQIPGIGTGSGHDPDDEVDDAVELGESVGEALAELVSQTPGIATGSGHESAGTLAARR
jgi:hypothetical protein